jgi:[ribosomal protein S18]-alanine N-acetyltransferase
MTQWNLSALSPVDIDPILDIEGRSFGWPWGRLSFEGEADSPGAGSWVVRMPGPTGGEQVVAYIFFRLIADEVHIFRIAVAPEWRRRGIGARLVAECLAAATRRGARVAVLEVRPSSTEALALYLKFGFRVVATRPGYYSDSGEDALILQKEIKEENL